MCSEGDSILSPASFNAIESIWGLGKGVEGAIIEAYAVLTCPTMRSLRNMLALCVDSPDIPSDGDEFADPIEAPEATVPAPHGRSDTRDQSALASASASVEGVFVPSLYLS
jgi:hypothetical protein